MKRYKRQLIVFLVCVSIFFSINTSLSAGDVIPAQNDFFVIKKYEERLSIVEKQIPLIVSAAEAVAKRWVENKQVLLHYPFGGDTSNFTMEFIARAGGLDNAQPSTLRIKLRSSNDVFVCSARSWEKGGLFLSKELEKSKQSGWLNIVFASKNGMPEGLPVDFLIDNGATTGNENEAAVNNIVNITNGWIFTCELVSALTRMSVRPGILKGMPLPGSIEHNKIYQHTNGLPVLYPCKTRIDAGILAKQYLKSVRSTIKILLSEKNIAQIEKASDIAVWKLARGHTVWVSSFTHVLDGEVFCNNKSPMKAFRGISCGPNGETFRKNLKEHDLLFWFGEWTVNLPWLDYLKIIRDTGADYIASYRQGNEKQQYYKEGNSIFYDTKMDDALMIINQYWDFENACVRIPFPPYKMAPISGVYVCLLYRMLDEEIAKKLLLVPSVTTKREMQLCTK
ncbi:MAG TPA: hypothetical protein PKK91_06245 [bacterium]|nr:hypothetical protein [bacterium]